MIKNTDIAKELCLPPVKLHCSSKFSVISFTLVLFLPLHFLIKYFFSTVLAEDAIKAAVIDYQLKQQDVQQEAALSSN